MAEELTRRCVLGGLTALATGCASNIPAAAPSSTPTHIGLKPGVCLLRSDVFPEEVLGREVVMMRSGCLAILLDDQPPPPTVEASPVDDLAGRTTVNHQLAYPVRRVERGHVAPTPDVRPATEFGFTMHTGGPIEWVALASESPHPEGAAIVTAVASGPREVCTLYGNCDGSASEFGAIAISVSGVAGPPGRLEAVLTSTSLELQVRPLPWVRVVVHERRAAETRLLWASGRHEFVLGSPPAASAHPHQWPEAPFVYPVRLPRNAGLDEAVLDVTYLAWDAPDISPARLHDRASWEAFVHDAPPSLVRRTEVPVSRMSSGEAG